MNQIKLNNDNIIYTSEISQKEFDCFIDCLIDYISVYPDGNHNFLYKRLKYIRIELIRQIISLIMNEETIMYLFTIDKAKITDFASILFCETRTIQQFNNYNTSFDYNNYKLREINSNQQIPIPLQDIENNISITTENNNISKVYIPPHKRNTKKIDL